MDSVGKHTAQAGRLAWAQIFRDQIACKSMTASNMSNVRNAEL